MEKTKNKRLSLIWVGTVIVLGAIIVIAIMSWFLYKHTVILLSDNLRQRLLSIAITQVANIDPDDIQSLQVEGDWKKPAWSRVVGQLKRAKNSNPNIVYMYIFKKSDIDSTKMVFVADAESLNPYANIDNDLANDVDANGDGKIEPDGADNLQWPSQEYPEPPAETFESYNGPLTSKDLYSDEYGKVLTGYAPILDSNQNVIAVLATDIRANDFSTITTQTLIPFIGFIIFLVFAIIVLALSLIMVWNKRVEVFAELDRQKDELLGMVSHQLATPVSSLRWYMEMFLDGDLGKVTDEQRVHLVSAQSVATNLSDLVSLILDVSRIQLGRVKVEKGKLKLDDLFKEILDIIKPKAEQKGVHFKVSIDKKLPVAMLDKRYTHMTIENLLSNAVKYTQPKGTVNFTVAVKGETLYCEVSDTGVGIPKADQSQIFGKLFRASNVRNEVDGNGFGLYVAKGAIEAQGGKIWFKSEEGKGTTFYVELPLNDGK